ncbi:putative reverse transcriptase domain-containing protein [Tanacetum coccineum]
MLPRTKSTESPVHRIQVIEGVQREQGRRIVGVESAVTALTERIAELERDNRRLRGTASVEGQRVDRLQRGMSRMQRELRQIRQEIEDLVSHRVAKEMEAREAAMNLEPLNESRDEQDGEKGGNGNGGKWREWRKWKLREWRKWKWRKWEWKWRKWKWRKERKWKQKWESWHELWRPIGVDAAHSMKWAGLMKLMTEVYCPRNEIQKMEIELRNLTVKGNDLIAYTQRGLPYNIQGNAIAANPIRIANQLMDKKLQGYAARSAKNKRRMESNPRDNHGQQPPFKRQNVSVARAYTTGNNKRRGSAVIIPNTQRDPLGNQQGVICYECQRPGHVKRDCPKLRNQNHGNRVGNKTGNKMGNNEATERAYTIGGGGADPDSNVVMGTFLLNNCYASILFDSGADRSFVSSTFSALLDVAPSTLDTSYAVELADGRIS